MRYIDADAFETFGYKVSGGSDDFKDGFDEGVQFVLECIDNVPTADVRENVHGKWIIHKDSAIVHDRLITNYECSVCRVWSRYHSNFCPNCGADMRGEE